MNQIVDKIFIAWVLLAWMLLYANPGNILLYAQVLSVAQAALVGLLVSTAVRFFVTVRGVNRRGILYLTTAVIASALVAFVYGYLQEAELFQYVGRVVLVAAVIILLDLLHTSHGNPKRKLLHELVVILLGFLVAVVSYRFVEILLPDTYILYMITCVVLVRFATDDLLQRYL